METESENTSRPAGERSKKPAGTALATPQGNRVWRARVFSLSRLPGRVRGQPLRKRKLASKNPGKPPHPECEKSGQNTDPA
jgi:hypothetical protein